MADIVLSIAGLTKAFGAAVALSGVDIDLRRGETHALIGENGSGKSTLVKVLAGYHRADAGEIRINGGLLEVTDLRATDAAGLRFVHQDLGLISTLDTVDNLGLSRGATTRLLHPVDRRREAFDADSALARLGYSFDVRRPLEQLSISERTAVAIARALSPHRSDPQVLILDEPTANLPAPEVQRLFEVLRNVRDQGVAIMLISHHFNEVFDLCDRVTVLRDGAVAGTHLTGEIDEPALIELMLGHRLTTHAQSAGGTPGDNVLRVAGLAGEVIDGLDLEVRAGEVIGVAGITGSGRDELAGLLFGDRHRLGTVEVVGRPLAAGRPDLAKEAGVAYLAADRQTNAVLHEHNVRENITITNPQKYMMSGVLRRKAEVADVNELLTMLDVRPLRTEVPISALSGGNQQKVMLARWLRTNPRLMILDEPTQGVDVGAKEEIHKLIDAAAAEGRAIVVCSSESEELARLSDRVIVLSGGHQVETLTAPLTPDAISLATLKRREAA